MPVARMMAAYRTLKGLLSEPQKQSYFKEQPQKNRRQMFMDHVRWFLKYGEINHFYYTYGFDVMRDIDLNQYFSKRQANKMRDRLNTTVYIGNQKTSYVCLLRDKFVFGCYMKALGFKTPKIHAFCDKQTITWVETGATETLAAFEKLGEGEYFIKEVLSGCGEGVYPIQVHNGGIFMNDLDIGLDGLRDKIHDVCIVQEKIVQHPVMSQLNGSSVNTLRLVTALKNDDPVLISGIVRIGSRSGRLDNWSAGGIGVGINLEQGTLKKNGFRRPEYAERWEQHPDTRVTFEGFKIPLFEKVVETTLETHRMFYGIHSIGWDIAITEDGPVFIEGNNLWEVPMMQVHDNRIKEKYLATVPNLPRQL